MRSILASLLEAVLSVALFVMRKLNGATQVHHVTDDGIRMRALRVARPGKPVAVLIHGFSDRPETFLRMASRLSDYDVVIPALPGFHDGLVEGARYEIRSYARWVASLLDALGVRDAHLCGNSLGGATALVLAVDRPDLVRTLVPLDTGGIDAPGVASIHDEVRAGKNLFLVRRADEVPAFLKRIFHKPPPSFTPVRHLLAIQLAEKAHTYGTIMDHLAEEGLAHQERGAIVDLQAVDRPTLVAWGDRDTLFPLAVGEHLAEQIGSARLHVFEETGHCPHIERPYALARVCASFWSEHDLQRT